MDPLLPEGTEPPPDLPPHIFQAALDSFLAGRRIDMRSLAAELGMGRATLYRRGGSRDALLGHVLWYLTRRNLVRSARSADGLSGADRIATTVSNLLTYVDAQPSLRQFVASEPETALRILTSRRGVVQAGVVDHLARIIEQEVACGAYQPRLPPRTLAYVIVRIGEGFLYADVIADGEPDVAQAMTVIEQLLVV